MPNTELDELLRSLDLVSTLSREASQLGKLHGMMTLEAQHRALSLQQIASADALSLVTGLEKTALEQAKMTGALGLLNRDFGALGLVTRYGHSHIDFLRTLETTCKQATTLGVDLHLQQYERLRFASESVANVSGRRAALELCGIPSSNELASLYAKIQEGISARGFDASLLSSEKVIRAATSLTSPWVNSANIMQSFEGFSHLAALGKAFDFLAYDPRSTAISKAFLGDWSAVDTLPQRIFVDWQARQDFYYEHGLDKSLLVLPEPAFTEGLYKVGILRPALFPLRSYRRRTKRRRFYSLKERNAQRTLETHEIIRQLEIELREFIHGVMTERFGPNWEKQHVSGDLRSAWMKKREMAQKAGEKEDRLLWFADFTDYKTIIEQNHNWNEVFEPIFGDKMNMQVSFKRLFPIRIRDAHNRVITKADYILACYESSNILRAIGVLDDNDCED